MVESDKVRESSIWKYLNELILDVIKAPGGETQEIPTPKKLALWQYKRRWQEHRNLTTSDPNHNPRGAHRSVPVISDPGFGVVSGYPSVILSDKPTNDTSTVPIINIFSAPSENPTKYTSHVPKKF